MFLFAACAPIVCRDGFVSMLLFMPVVVDNANFVFLTSLHGFVFVPLGPRYWFICDCGVKEL